MSRLDEMTRRLLTENHDVYDRLRAEGLHDEAAHVWMLGAVLGMTHELLSIPEGYRHEAHSHQS